MDYWGFSTNYTDESLKIDLKLREFTQDIFRKMMEMEEQATLDAVIQYLRTSGYTVTKDEEKK